MAQQRIKRSIDSEAGNVTFEIVASGAKLVVKAADFSADIQSRLILHGINGKVGDSAADPKLDAMEQLQATVKQLTEGTWAARASGGGGASSTLLSEALIRVTGKTADEVKEKLESLTDDEKKAMKKHAQVAAEIDKIKAERARDAAKKSAGAIKDEDKLEF